MPIPNYQNLDPSWTQAFPNALQILNSPGYVERQGQLARYAEALAYSRHLTPQQAAAVEQIAAQYSSRDALDPAQILDGWQIPNGVYVIRDDEGTANRYNIHLVQEGDLAGQRVLKRYVDGRYKGFAWIDRNGYMRLWRRFADQADSDFVTLADWLLTFLRGVGRERILQDRSFRINDVHRTVEVEPRCFNCNTSNHVDHFGCCSDRECESLHPYYFVSFPPVSQWAIEARIAEEREAAQRAIEERRARLEAQREAIAQEAARAAENRIAQARERLLRSEITPSEVR